MKLLVGRPQKWYFQIPIKNVDELKQAIFVLTEHVERSAGIISTCEWEVFYNFNYDVRYLVVAYQRWI